MRYNFAVVDLETSRENRGSTAVGTHEAAPWYKDNQIVAACVHTRAEEDKYGTAYSDVATTHISDPNFFDVMNNIRVFLRASDIIVGHNIKFDLQWLVREGILDTFNVSVWDTMHAEYLLSGQFDIMPSLDITAPRYGGHVKDEKIKQYWKGGYRTEDIPKADLVRYLFGDVRNTEKVFLGQFQAAQERGMLPLMFSQMDAIAATAEMEYNGMAFDVGLATKRSRELERQAQDILDHSYSLLSLIDSRLNKDIFSPTSAKQLSALLFGGDITYTYEGAAVDKHGNVQYYKSGIRAGELKTKKYAARMKLPRRVEPAEVGAESNSHGYTVNEEVLSAIVNQYSSDLVHYCQSILQYRRLHKDIRTYYEGFSALTWAEPEGVFIHGNLIHSKTRTGRLSSSQPNLQNLTNK